MASASAALVDILRDFLNVHDVLGRLCQRFRAGELRFDEVQDLIVDDERSVLFRLKERCHALVRPGGVAARKISGREALFDLAVGSLFHEAMKFRENFYQREVYGPRMRALRSEAAGDVDKIFQEFQKIQDTVSERLEEGLQETETLLGQTRDQLLLVLAEHRENGHVARCLLENRDLAVEVFSARFDAVVERIHGDAAAGYAVAGRSYLISGYFEEAEHALGEAIERGGDRGALERAAAYARGMAAYLAGDYDTSLGHLGQWVDPGAAENSTLAERARSAVSKIDQLVRGDDREQITAAASALLERLEVVQTERTATG